MLRTAFLYGLILAVAGFVVVWIEASTSFGLIAPQFGLIALAAKARGTAYRTMRRDARGHRSPNAGWPEAAMAGALGVRLSGPRHYADGPSEDPFLNPVGGDPRPKDIFLGLRLFRRAVLFAGVGLAGWAVVLP